MDKFKEQHSYDTRVEDSERIRKRHPDRIPIIVGTESKWFSSDLPPLVSQKYLVPKDLTVGQFIYTLRKKIRLAPEKTIFMFINNSLPQTSALMSQIDDEHRDADGYLYGVLAAENSFGHNNGQSPK
jgi:GABA(A) receptor-associated protein